MWKLFLSDLHTIFLYLAIQSYPVNLNADDAEDVFETKPNGFFRRLNHSFWLINDLLSLLVVCQIGVAKTINEVTFLVLV